MVMVLWPVVEIKTWVARMDGWLREWPVRTGRRCPACGARALVGHGLRRRSVHVGRSRAGLRCDVVWILVQRVRCKVCGRTHTLLPAFLAPYHVHRSVTRGRATAERAGGVSWAGVLARLGLPMLSTTSVRRWVSAVTTRLPAVMDQVIRWRAMVPGLAGYASTERPGSYAAFAAEVHELQSRQVAQWPTGEALAGANWQASKRGSPSWI